MVGVNSGLWEDTIGEKQGGKKEMLLSGQLHLTARSGEFFFFFHPPFALIRGLR